MCYFRTCQEQWVEQPRLGGRNQMQEPDWRAGTHSLGFGSTLNPALHRTVCPSTVQMRPGLHMNNEHQLPAACGQSPCSEIDHFLLSCKHALIFCTLKLADVSWIAYRLELLPFQSQGECSPDYNAHIYGWDLFFFCFNANDFHLWNKITTNYGFQSLKSEESRLKKEVTSTTSTHCSAFMWSED